MKKWLFLLSVVLLPLLLTSSKKIEGCSFNGIPLRGKVRVVTAFPDFKVRVVSVFPDIKVEKVDAFPDKCGQWQFVDAFEDFTIQYVDAFEDFTIEYVTSFPGTN